MTGTKSSPAAALLRVSALPALAALVALAGCTDHTGGGGGGTTAPHAPTGVTATGGNAQVTLSWSPVSGATGYNAYWSTATGVNRTNGAKIAGVTSPYTHTGLSDATTYYYVVTAVNAKGESAESAQVAATTLDTTGAGGSSGSGGTTFTCGAGSHPLRKDPLFAAQWYLDNTGQTAFSSFPGYANEDIHLCAAPERGTGVIVAVVDTGVEIAHEDLTENVLNPGGSVNPHSFNFDPTVAGTPAENDPTNATETAGDHGTSVSGILAARSDNGTGMSGVAGLAGLVGYNLLGPFTPQLSANVDEADALGQALYSAGVHIFNLSWGFDEFDAVNVANENPEAESNFLDGVTSLRGGKGAVYVKAAGNGFGVDYDIYDDPTNPTECTTPLLACQNANMDPYNTLPYLIVVGAVNAYGVRSSYSTAGSALWVSAPGGEFGFDVAAGWQPPPTNPHVAFEPAIVTTDQTGCGVGYSIAPDLNAANLFEDAQDPLNLNCNYTSTFNGSSSAAPVVSGVIALLLEANPNLTWRDVKHILAKTSEPIDAGFTPIVIQLGDGPYVAEPGWVTNGKGYRFHDWYGFGRIHADAALAMAKAAGFTPNGFGGNTPFNTLAQTTGTNGFVAGTVTTAAIPDHSVVGAGGTVTLASAQTGSMSFIEAVQVRVDISHTFSGDVGIEVTSPAGTRSVLLNIRSALGASKDIPNWVILSNAFYGEDPNGVWTIKVVDGTPTDTGRLNNWAIRIYGH